MTLNSGATDGEFVHKFGRNIAITSTFKPITMGGVYRTPQVSGATKLRVKAGHANDTALGTGARTVLLTGLDETGAEIMEVLTTAGASPSADTLQLYMRLYRVELLTSGVYANADVGSHAADIVIENAAGTEDWATIDSTGYPKGQSEIGAFTIPLGKVARLRVITATVDSTKSIDLMLLQRRDILQTAAPYSPWRNVNLQTGVSGNFTLDTHNPEGPFPALTDLVFMGKIASGPATAEVDIEISLTDD